MFRVFLSGGSLVEMVSVEIKNRISEDWCCPMDLGITKPTRAILQLQNEEADHNKLYNNS